MKVFSCVLSLAGTATSIVFCRDKSMLIATKHLSPQTSVCREKHNFVATSILLSRQKICFCRNKMHVMFVVTKMILVAAPVNDSEDRLSAGESLWQSAPYFRRGGSLTECTVLGRSVSNSKQRLSSSRAA